VTPPTEGDAAADCQDALLLARRDDAETLVERGWRPTPPAEGDDLCPGCGHDALRARAPREVVDRIMERLDATPPTEDGDE
jgi:hypothetical protein